MLLIQIELGLIAASVLYLAHSYFMDRGWRRRP